MLEQYLSAEIMNEKPRKPMTQNVVITVENDGIS